MNPKNQRKIKKDAKVYHGQSTDDEFQVAGSTSYMNCDDEQISLQNQNVSHHHIQSASFQLPSSQNNFPSNEQLDAQIELINQKEIEKANSVPLCIKGLIFFEYVLQKKLSLLRRSQSSDPTYSEKSLQALNMYKQNLFKKLSEVRKHRIDNIPDKHKRFYMTDKDQRELLKKKFIDLNVQKELEKFQKIESISNKSLRQKFPNQVSQVERILKNNTMSTPSSRIKSVIENIQERQTLERKQVLEKRINELKESLKEISQLTDSYVRKHIQAFKIYDKAEQAKKSQEQGSLLGEPMGFEASVLNPESMFRIFEMNKKSKL